jgi:Domain of unknown function (DUF4193)
LAANDELEQLEPQEQELEAEELEASDEEDEDIAQLAAGDDEPDPAESSLDELLAPHASTRRGREESEEEEDIISALVPDPDIAVVEPLPSVVLPIKDNQEFVCTSCHLVKARSQLVDESRGLCRDCV